jgi:hypothetical protein
MQNAPAACRPGPGSMVPVSFILTNGTGGRLRTVFAVFLYDSPATNTFRLLRFYDFKTEAALAL